MDTPASMRQQGSLFDEGRAPGHDPAFGTLRRETLTRGAWVDIARGWADGHGELFDLVLQAADWQVWQREMFDTVVDQPRLSTSWVGSELPAPLAAVGTMSDDLSRRYGVTLDRISANLYRDGQDSVAWHGDTHLRDQPTATVAVLSLGFRPAGKKRVTR